MRVTVGLTVEQAHSLVSEAMTGSVSPFAPARSGWKLQTAGKAATADGNCLRVVILFPQMTLSLLQGRISDRPATAVRRISIVPRVGPDIH